MSSHKEAPAIAEDPSADNTDLYAFVSPDSPDTVTLIANFVPLEDPAGGPNFSVFGDSVQYQIKVDNDGDGVEDVVFGFHFSTTYAYPNSFLYNIGPITTLDSANLNRRQTYSVTVTNVAAGTTTTLGSGLKCPPCNIGPASTPKYAALATAATYDLGGGHKVFAGQRAEGFYVDLGAIFDLGDLRPFQNLHILTNMPKTKGINATKYKNVHTIAIQVPKSTLTSDGGNPTDPTKPGSTIGVWANTRRNRVRMYDFNGDGSIQDTGPLVQVSRLGNPLINEVIIPIGKKDYWNSQQPSNDSQFASNYANPELSTLLPVLYPNAFPNLKKLNDSKKPRADIEAILLTGLPAGIIPGFQNFTGTVQADQLRLNMAIPPAKKPSNLGLLGADAAGFPNGRRVFDDVTTIELRALAGATYALVDKTFTPDAAAGAITQGINSSNSDLTASNTVHYLSSFPYLGTPHAGYDVPNDNEPAPVTVY
jgi:hypothetical protein